MANENRMSDIEVASRLSAIETELKILGSAFGVHQDKTDSYRTDLKILVASLTASMQGQAKELSELKPPMQALTQNMAEMKIDVHSLLDDMVEMKPDVHASTERWTEARGAAKLGRLIWVGVVGISSMISGAIVFLMTKLFDHSPGR